MCKYTLHIIECIKICKRKTWDLLIERANGAAKTRSACYCIKRPPADVININDYNIMFAEITIWHLYLEVY